MAEDMQSKLIDRLMGKIPIIESLSDIEAAAKPVIESEFGLKGAERDALAHKFASFDIIHPLLDDANVEDIIIHSLNPIYVSHAKAGMVKTDRKFASVEDLFLFIRKLQLFSGSAKKGRRLDLRIPGGARANVIDSPLGPQITIRKFRASPPSVLELVDWGMLDFHLAAWLWMFAEGLGTKPANILICGPSGSGKTTLLNAMFSFFPSNEHVVVIEDTMELNTLKVENVARLESDDELDMEKLVKNSMRMRPDRLIIGEVRGEEAQDMMTAMNVGKICMGTMHASSAREAVTRLENAPMRIPIDSIPLIDIFIVTRRFRMGPKTLRSVTEVSEVGGIETKVLLSELYTFDFQEKQLKEVQPSVVYRDRLAEAAGVSPKVILDEVDHREKILRKLSELNMRSITQISEFCTLYYENHEKALSSIGMG